MSHSSDVIIFAHEKQSVDGSACRVVREDRCQTKKIRFYVVGKTGICVVIKEAGFRIGVGSRASEQEDDVQVATLVAV